MTERSAVIVRLGPPGQVASSQPTAATTRNVRTQLTHGEEAA
ncbi:MAG TPA: hypothetical protein VI011_00035 [Asanoa sp.]